MVSGPLPYSNEADVAANREARFSGRQMLGLWYSGLWRILIGLPTAGVAAAVGWQPQLWAMALGIGLFCAGLLLSWRGFSFLGDAITSNVTFVTAPIAKTSQTAKGSTTYFMSVGPVKTHISKKTYDAVPYGLSCHAYYASGSLHLLSLEPATEAEPHPSLRFGGDAAHAWDRLRWRLVIAAMAAFGLATSIHTVAIAHPAQTFTVSGSIADYQAKNGKYRHLYLVGDSQMYWLGRLDDYSPPIPNLGSYVGDKVDLYINSDSGGDVLALRLRETLHAADYYLHPDHQRGDMIYSGAPVALLSGITLVVALWWQFLIRMKEEIAPPLPTRERLIA